jgi:hypothetical protein
VENLSTYSNNIADTFPLITLFGSQAH